MDLHAPCFPGLRHAFSEGLLKSYYATVRNYRKNARGEFDLSKGVRNRLQSLYWRTVEQLDSHLPELLSIAPGDAITILTADHGEEFNHGVVGHARLYDESVRVPLVWKRAPATVMETPVRHIDLAPTLLNQLDVPAPDSWTGRPHTGTLRRAHMITFAPAIGRSYAALRGEHKLIWTFDYETGERLSEEFFNLSTDPYEMNTIDGPLKEYRVSLQQFVDREPIRSFSTPLETGDVDVPDSHLRELGYIE